jgi:hypothetical protein
MTDSQLTYGGYKNSKTGERVPFFINDSAMYSLYNPLRDAETFAHVFDGADGADGARFAVVFGLGNGLHITELAKKEQHLRILVVEHSKENIAFLKKDSSSARVFALPLVTVCSIEDLYSAFLGAYIPSLHGSVRVMYQQAWKNFHPKDCELGTQIIARAAESAKNDYTTQAHFGRLWHRNILLNLALLRGKDGARFELPVHKEACVIAAGPSLDKSAHNLLVNRRDKFIIATDTAYEALVKRRITPDAVVTIDGQSVSARHFFKSGQDLPREGRTTLFADLCCNPCVPRLFFKRGQKVVFTQNRHPLAELASQYAKNRGASQSFLPFISSGAGTVTVSAAALAFKSGFSRVTFFGADFAFLGGKPYARGTYLDNFFAAASRIVPGETAFGALMFRGETRACQHEPEAKTTPLLLLYKRSLETLCAEQKNSGESPVDFFCGGGIYLDGFFDWYEEELALAMLNTRELRPLRNSDGILYSCLPLLAHETTRGKNIDFFGVLKLAYNALKRYTVTQ